jgi:hypothetical protein
MKKSMIASGAFTAAALSLGIIMKYMHAAGTMVILTAGIFAACFVFLPLLFGVRVKEKKNTGEKVLLAISSIAWMSAILGVLFKVNHWPFATFLFYSTPFILIAVYLPLYFFIGIAKPEMRLETVAHSVLIVIACGLFFTLLVTPATERIQTIRATAGVWRSEQILKAEKQLYAAGSTDTVGVLTGISNLLLADCEAVKAQILEAETGSRSLPDDFEHREILIPEQHSVSSGFVDNYPGLDAKLNILSSHLQQYNSVVVTSGVMPIPEENGVVDMNKATAMGYKVSACLNNIIGIEMMILQNMRKGHR